MTGIGYSAQWSFLGGGPVVDHRGFLKMIK
jgi:hypothetical protein